MKSNRKKKNAPARPEPAKTETQPALKAAPKKEALKAAPQPEKLKAAPKKEALPSRKS